MLVSSKVPLYATIFRGVAEGANVGEGAAGDGMTVGSSKITLGGQFKVGCPAAARCGGLRNGP